MAFAESPGSLPFWRCALAALLLVIAVLWRPTAAEANGAFPDSLQLLLPKTAPSRIVVATNFGLIGSEDDGASWDWSCEHGASLGAWLYQSGWGPRGTRILAISAAGLVLTDDVGCGWRSASGLPARTVVKDFFVDPGEPRRVLCIGSRPDQNPARDQLFSSEDGGDSFPRMLLDAPEGVSLVGIETAASDPSVVYVTMRTAQPQARSQVGRSGDGGQTWETFTLNEDLAGNDLSIIGVSRSQPDRVLFRSTAGIRDRVALTEDGGRTVRVVLETAGVLTSYVERSNGTILIGAL